MAILLLDGGGTIFIMHASAETVGERIVHEFCSYSLWSVNASLNVASQWNGLIVSNVKNNVTHFREQQNNTTRNWLLMYSFIGVP